MSDRPAKSVISREEALSWLDPVDELGTAPDFDAIKAINLIYDSIGSCRDCESFDYIEGAALGECIMYGCLKVPSGYCDEYKERE
jgi:hypothetical protein